MSAARPTVHFRVNFSGSSYPACGAKRTPYVSIFQSDVTCMECLKIMKKGEM